jgi:hypothetical protein
MSRELESAKAYNIINLRILKYLKLQQKHRVVQPNDFLIEIYSDYIKLYANSKLIRNVPDKVIYVKDDNEDEVKSITHDTASENESDVNSYSDDGDDNEVSITLNKNDENI